MSITTTLGKDMRVERYPRGYDGAWRRSTTTKLLEAVADQDEELMMD